MTLMSECLQHFTALLACFSDFYHSLIFLFLPSLSLFCRDMPESYTFLNILSLFTKGFILLTIEPIEDLYH